MFRLLLTASLLCAALAWVVPASGQTIGRTQVRGAVTLGPPASPALRPVERTSGDDRYRPLDLRPPDDLRPIGDLPAPYAARDADRGVESLPLEDIGDGRPDDGFGRPERPRRLDRYDDVRPAQFRDELGPPRFDSRDTYRPGYDPLADQPVSGDLFGGGGGGERYTAFQFDDSLPPPDLGLPAPGYDAIGRGGIAPRQTQPFGFDYTFLSSADVEGPDGDLAMHQANIFFEGHLPLGENFLVTLRPTADALFLSGPTGLDPAFPETLYQVYLDAQFDWRLTDRVGLTVAVTPGLWTDFSSVGGDDFRLPARVFLTFRFSEDLFVAAGVVYTDNIRRNLLPGVGLLWRINERWKVELLYPRSRLVYIWHENLHFYFVAQRGGTTYAIDEILGEEQIEYRDLRFLGGVEFSGWDRATWFVEAGAATLRKFRFERQRDVDIDTSFLVRAGVRF